MRFWYRTDLFAQHGIKEPKSYAELEQICTTLQGKGINCASFGGKLGWHPMRLLDTFIEMTCGPAVHDQLSTLQARWDQPCVVDAYTRMRKRVDNRWLVPDFLTVTPTDARMPLYLGTAAMIIEGDNFEVVVRDGKQAAETFDFFLPPTGHEPARFHAYPEQWMIPTGSKKPDAAAAFIDWITQPDVQERHSAALTSTAVVGVEPDCKQWPQSCEWRRLVTADPKTFPPTDQAFTKELMDSFFEAQDGIIAGKLSPEAGAKLMQQRPEPWKASRGQDGPPGRARRPGDRSA